MLVAMLICVATSACSLMHDDLDPCAVKPNTYTRIKFKYDYNTRGADRFKDEIGGVTVYVFDSAKRLVAVEERTNASSGNALKKGEFMIEFNSDVVKPGSSYTFYAIGHGNDKGYDGALAMPGAAFRRCNTIALGSSPEDFYMLLDRDANNTVDHDGVIIDHLFATLTPATLNIPEEKEPAEGDPQEEDHILTATIPLMRITNYITVSFWESTFPIAIDPDQYELSLTTSCGHGQLDFLGNPTGTSPLRHIPVEMWKETRHIDGTETHCACARFGVSRLMLNDNMVLTVTDKANHRTMTLGEIPKLLSKGNEAMAEKRWTAQEYLDRECEYSFDFPLDGEVPRWVQININILGWSKRIQMENL